MKTKADLRAVILTDLGVIDPEETPSNEQAKRLDLYIDGDYAGLREKGLGWWDEDSIPDEILLPLADFIKARAAAGFGRAGKGFEQLREPARAEIAALKSSEQRETTPGEYY